MSIDVAIQNGKNIDASKRADADWKWRYGSINTDEYIEEIISVCPFCGKKLKCTEILNIFFCDECKVHMRIKTVITKEYKEGYMQAIDDFVKKLQPHIIDYQNAIKKNRYAFIDLGNMAEQLKESVK